MDLLSAFRKIWKIRMDSETLLREEVDYTKNIL